MTPAERAEGRAALVNIGARCWLLLAVVGAAILGLESASWVVAALVLIAGLITALPLCAISWVLDAQADNLRPPELDLEPRDVPRATRMSRPTSDGRPREDER